MEFQHSCSFCGWHRFSRTPVMLSPSCERCGCPLDASAVSRDAGPRPAASVVISPSVLAVLRALGVLCCALTLYAAGKLGYEAGGASGALIAFGAGGFLLLPFVPERIR
jgi:hypothetical protein